jgi:hypothetical protein
MFEFVRHQIWTNVCDTKEHVAHSARAQSGQTIIDPCLDKKKVIPGICFRVLHYPGT